MSGKLRLAIIIGGVVLVLLLIVLVASSKKPAPKPKRPSSNDKITLTYWRLFDDSSVFDQIIEDYQKDHPNVTIDYKKLTPDNYEQTLNDALASGRGPDLFSVHNDWMPKFFEKIAPAPSSVMSTQEYKRSFFPVAADDNIKDDQIYGIPYSIDNLALYYNRDLLNQGGVSEPPATWDDLVGVPKDPTKPGDQGKQSMIAAIAKPQGGTFVPSAIAMGNANVNRSQDILSAIMLQQHTNMVNDNRDQATFNLTQKVNGKDEYRGTAALKFYTSFATPKTGTYNWNASLGDSVKAFSQGKVAMMINYSYQIAALGKADPNLKFDIAPLPQLAGQDPVTYASYWTEVVSKASKHQKEAWDFIKFVSSKDELRDYIESANVPSSRTDVTSGGKQQVFYEQNKSAKSWYKGDAGQADALFMAMITELLANKDISEAGTAAAAQRAIDAAANKETQVLRQLKGQGSTAPPNTSRDAG